MSLPPCYINWLTIPPTYTKMCLWLLPEPHTASSPAGSVYFFLPGQADRESGMDSKGCSLGRDKALVSTPWARALLWIITPLSGVAAVCVYLCGCVYMNVCACLLACLWQNERGGNWNRERPININIILSHQGSFYIFCWSITFTTAPYRLFSYFRNHLEYYGTT